MNRRLIRLITLLLVFLADAPFLYAATIKVACIGNSVTYGYGLKHPELESYPVQLQKLLGDHYTVKNFGHSGATLLKQGHNPYIKTPEYTGVLAFQPDIAIIHLGLNDTDPRDWPDHQLEFEANYATLIQSIREASPGVKIFVCRLTPIFSGHPRFKSGTRDWYREIQQLIPGIAKANQAGLIDLHEPLYHRPDLFADNLHPDREGALIIAQTVYSVLSGNFGGLKLPDAFANHMVIQRNRPIIVYGQANKGDSIKVSFKGRTIQTKPNEYGQWQVVFAPGKAGCPYQLNVAGRDSTITIGDILIGDVWLCAGQSNIFFSLKKATGGEVEIAAAELNKHLRLYRFKEQAETDAVPWDSVSMLKANQLHFFSGKWERSNALSAADFSAIAYCFGKKIAIDENVPIGLIQVAVGGSPTESWIDRETMEGDDQLVDMLNNWRQSDFVNPFCRDRAGINLKNAINPKQRHTYEPSYNYEAPIAPLTRFAIKGVIWYQGESNTHNIAVYNHLFKTMVNSWRNHWGYQLPFYYVQLSGISRPSWPVFRDEQQKLQKQIPLSHMAISFDLGDSLNVHPIKKKEIAERLSLLAERYTYKKMLQADGPQPMKAKWIGKEIVLSFSFGRALRVQAAKPLLGFELVNNRGERFDAKGIIKNNRVHLQVPAGETIMAIYYAMQPFSHANLINGAGLPAATFTMLWHEKEQLFY